MVRVVADKKEAADSFRKTVQMIKERCGVEDALQGWRIGGVYYICDTLAEALFSAADEADEADSIKLRAGGYLLESMA